jgi:GNAT superfamily N-acetyltransferase
MIIFSDRKDIDLAQLVALYRQAPWASTRTLEDARDMLTHTDVAITAWNGDRLVGLGRVLTDYVYRASIWDVIVDTAYQGQDIGTQIIQRILEYPDLKRVELFWLCFSSKDQTGMVWARAKDTCQE